MSEASNGMIWGVALPRAIDEVVDQRRRDLLEFWSDPSIHASSAATRDERA